MDNQNSNKEKEILILKIKEAKKNDIIFCLLKSVPFLIIILLFAIPFINVNYIFGETDISFFDLFFSSSKSESENGIFASGIMADFFNMGEEYKNIFSGLFNTAIFEVDNFSQLSTVNKILVTLKNAILMIISPMSFLTIIVVTFVSIVIVIDSIFNSNVELPLRMLDDIAYERIVHPEKGIDYLCEETNEGKSNIKLQKIVNKITNSDLKVPLKKFIKDALGWLVTVALYVYIPLKLIIFLANYPLVTVSNLFIVLYAICIIVGTIFNLVEHAYYNKKAWLFSIVFKAKMISK